MQLTIPRRVVVISTLAFVLGMASPVVALAADDTTNLTDDNQLTLVTPTDENEGTTEGQSQGSDSVVIEDESDGSEATPTDVTTEDTTTVDETTTTDPVNNDTEAVEDDGTTEDNGDTEGDAPVAEEPAAPSIETVEDTDVAVETQESDEVAATAAPATLASAPTAGSATTQSDEDLRPVANGTYVISSVMKNSMVLDVVNNGSKAGSNVQLYTSKGSAGQRWDIRYVSDGFYRILKHGTTLALAIAGNKAEYGTNVELANQSDAKGQLWQFVKSESGYYNIVSALSSKIVIDINNGKTVDQANIQVWKKKDKGPQQFRLFVSSSAARSDVTIADGTYTIRPAANTAYSVDIKSGSKANGANVQLHSYNGTQAQKYYFQSDGNGYYIINVIGSGKVLAAENGSVIPGTNVVQSTYKGTNIQKWALQKTATGYRLINKATRLAIDIKGEKYANGTNLRGNTVRNVARENFKLTRVSTLADGIYEIANIKNANNIFDIKSSAVQLSADSDAFSQRFEIIRTNTGSTEIYRIRTAASGGWLTSSGSSVVQSGKRRTSVTTANSWQLVWNGTYFSLSNRKTGNVLTLKGGSTASGTAIQNSAASKSTSQHFYFNPANLLNNGTYLFVEGIYSSSAGDRTLDTNNNNARSCTKSGSRDQRIALKATGSSTNTYVIKNAYDNHIVSLASSKDPEGKKDGLNVLTLEKDTGASSQRWEAKIADGGYVMFVNKYSGKAMTVKDGGKSSGTNIVQFTFDEGVDDKPSQKFKPTRIEWEVKGDKYYYYDVNGKKTEWTKPTYTAYRKLNYSKEVQDEKNTKPYASTIDVDACWVNVFKNAGGMWEPYKCWRCSTGANKTNWATPRGLFHTTGKKGNYGETENLPWGFYYVTVWYPRDYGGTGFHSIIYHPKSYNVLDGRLGAHITGGSVRLSLENAKWIYDHFSKGTIVYSF